MNEVTLPPSPSWYSPSVMCCAPDNTLIYGGYNNFTVLTPSVDDTPNGIKIFPTFNRIVCTQHNPKWGDPEKLAAVFSVDGIVSIWNVETKKMINSKKLSNSQNEKLIGGCYAGNEKIVAAFEKGDIVVWRLATDEVNTLKLFPNNKIFATYFIINPHISYYAAMGFKNGLICVLDLRKDGKILHKLKSNKSNSVTSLSWCPLPYNLIERNKVQEEKKENNLSNRNDSLEKIINEFAEDSITNTLEKLNISTDDIQAEAAGDDTKTVKSQVNEELNDDHDIQAGVVGDNTNTLKTEVNEELNDDLNNTSCERKIKLNPWVNLVHADDDEIHSDPEHALSDAPIDFAEECRLLREKIEKTKPSSEQETKNIMETPNKSDRIILKPRGRGKPKTEANETDEDKLSTVDSVSEDLSSLVVTIQAENDGESVKAEVSPQVEKKEYLLSSVDCEGVVYVWRTTDGRMIKKLTPKEMKRKAFKLKPMPSFATLCFISPTTIISSNRKGHLLKWNLLDANPDYKFINCDHNDFLFSIACNIKVLTDQDKEAWTKEPSTVWTFSKDRYLLNVSLGADRSVLSSYCTFAGNLSFLGTSPFDPSRVAVAIYQGRLFTWDLSKPHAKVINMTLLPCKTTDAINTVAWHPQKESCLAFGTSRGKIGIINTNNLGKPPTMLPEFFMSDIHKVEWGPKPGNSEQWALYVVSEGKLVYFHDTDNCREDPVLFPVKKSESTSNFAWKSDYSMIAIGTKTGSVSLYSKYLVQLVTVYVQTKMITAIKWHPFATLEDDDVSPLHSTFATVANTDICLYDVSKVNYSQNNQPVENIKTTIIKDAHKKIIRDIDWSSYEGGKLVTAGEDSIAKVWDVTTGQALKSFVYKDFPAPFTSVLWSPIDSKYIIIGTKAETMHIFNIENCSLISDEEHEELMKKRLSTIQSSKPNLVIRDESSNNAKLSKTATSNNLDIVPYISHMQFDAAERIIKLLIDRNPCEETAIQSEMVSSDTNNYKGEDWAVNFLKDKNHILECVNFERQNHMDHKRHLSADMLSLYKGDISEQLKMAIQEKRLTPWLLSIASMVSPKVWMEACESYAKQISESVNPNYQEAASYYLACHKIEEAIYTLIEGNFFYDAYVIAKCRLDSDDPLVNILLEKWGKYLVYTGQYEVAAQIFIAQGNYELAAVYLSKRTSKNVLELAVELAKNCDNTELLDSIRLRLDKLPESVVDEPKEKPLPTRFEAMLATIPKEDALDENQEMEEIEAICTEEVSNMDHSN